MGGSPWLAARTSARARWPRRLRLRAAPRRKGAGLGGSPLPPPPLPAAGAVAWRVAPRARFAGGWGRRPSRPQALRVGAPRSFWLPSSATMTGRSRSRSPVLGCVVSATRVLDAARRRLPLYRQALLGGLVLHSAPGGPAARSPAAAAPTPPPASPGPPSDDGGMEEIDDPGMAAVLDWSPGQWEIWWQASPWRQQFSIQQWQDFYVQRGWGQRAH